MTLGRFRHLWPCPREHRLRFQVLTPTLWLPRSADNYACFCNTPPVSSLANLTLRGEARWSPYKRGRKHHTNNQLWRSAYPGFEPVSAACCSSEAQPVVPSSVLLVSAERRLQWPPQLPAELDPVGWTPEAPQIATHAAASVARCHRLEGRPMLLPRGGTPPNHSAAFLAAPGLQEGVCHVRGGAVLRASTMGIFQRHRISSLQELAEDHTGMK